MASMAVFHNQKRHAVKLTVQNTADPGSIPGLGTFFLHFFGRVCDARQIVVFSTTGRRGVTETMLGTYHT